MMLINRYTMNLEGAADMDSDVESGDLSSTDRARMLFTCAQGHGVPDIRRLGDLLVVNDAGERLEFRTAASLMEWLGY